MIFQRHLGLIAAMIFITRAAGAPDIMLDAVNTGRTFEGIGALSAGASSRLLADYPEPQRSQILDYLFKPNYGAAMQHLKVEIGGEVNSTDGTEPTHMRTRTDENYTRGYEWWLMQQAKTRNPAIYLDSLMWGAPGWIGNGNFYSQDMADYVVKFIKGAKATNGLDINYTGIWNEKAYDATAYAWMKTLRTTLDANGLSSVKIIAADTYDLNIVSQMQSDSVLSTAVYAVGRHYPGYQSSAAAQALGKPLWAAEDGIGGSSWATAQKLAKIFNLNYVNGKYTKTEIWSPITSYFDNLAAADSGLMRANTPWSGNYQVCPAIWAMAHTTQFTFPGWKYLEGGASATLPLGGSIVTLKSTNNVDYSIIVETSGATNAQTVTFHLTNGLSTAAVNVWQSTSASQFIKVGTVTPVGGNFTYTFQTEAIYSLSPTMGQAKGSATPPAAANLPIPYSDDFESYATNKTPKFFSDQAGTFEVVKRADGQGQSLRQVLPQTGIEWVAEFTPYTMTGDASWKDYEVSANVLLETNGLAYVMGRIANVPGFNSPTPNGYWLLANSQSGIWELHAASNTIATGSVSFPTNVWHLLQLAFKGSSLSCYLNGTLLTNVTDSTFSSGMAGMGCGWHAAQFDNFLVRRMHRGPLANLALTAIASASSTWQADPITYAPGKANDGDPTTRWNSAYPTLSNEWLELDFRSSVTFNHTTYSEYGSRVSGYTLQHWNGSNWVNDVSGTNIGTYQSDVFNGVTASKVRLLFTSFSSSPSIYEFGVYADGIPPNIALTATASASSIWSSSYTAAMANDNDFNSRWNSGFNTTNNQWLELDFPLAMNFNQTVLTQFDATRVTSYQIQYWNGTSWIAVVTGGLLGASHTDTFPAVNSTKIRFYVLTAINPPSIYEFQVYYNLTANPAMAGGPVRINEWMINNTRTITDPADGLYKSWFELFNAGTTNVNLAGCYLSGSTNTSFQFKIPNGYVISPGGFQLVWAGGSTNLTPGLHVSFSLTNVPVIGLYDATGNQMDSVDLDSQAADASTGSKPDGDLAVVPLPLATPGRSNALVMATSIQKRASDGTLQLAFSGLPFASHRVQYNEYLGGNYWTNLSTQVANGLGFFSYAESNANRSQRFYRAVTP